ncbi:uncharacterized protein MELLADRAFT_113782 [Melampsora larici-populina 98AG31]|uniref:Carrier domain-containing protein n=1 Tax=Melampsora larici-populina (strain 98AG31 / pathotype 3-4-7) TaxID=747676 RepID=F4SB18_MELLP|nr:uncharacterized protein MELLADRAFT_113782 [Melampsora larici-populina 98AG31]EGF98163.1 hypothetical protein MELLADRAFT_113782 [Melampsora larici-populina 98AG31]
MLRVKSLGGQGSDEMEGVGFDSKEMISENLDRLSNIWLWTSKHGTNGPSASYFKNQHRKSATFSDLPNVKELHRKLASNRFANYLASHTSLPLRTQSNGSEQFTIGLLAESGPDFLITVLACFRLGLTILLLAPQLPTEHVNHLLKETHSSHLLVFESNSIKLDELRKTLTGVEIVNLSYGVTSINPNDLTEEIPEPKRWISYEEEGSRNAVIFHSSGTTGLPKPINTLHEYLTSNLPTTLNEGTSSFCTTPLYHGGFSDLFRSLNSLDPICFFALDSLPITFDNIYKSIQVCAKSIGQTQKNVSNVHQINTFLTVPYILRLIKSNPDGIALLQTMKYVCFGGASLEDTIGDELVREGINLASRYGSSESGFLLSSYRDFESDKDWNWLREPLTPIGDKTRTFQKIDDSTYELIIKKGWPQMAVHNIPNGDFATGDLFEPHSSKPRTWRYLGRGDDIIVLSNGEKLNPNLAEEILQEESDLVSSSLIFGSRRTHCGLVVLLVSDFGKLDNWKGRWNKLLEKVNRQLPSFAQIWPEMVIFLEAGIDPWPTSSKGLKQRKQINDLYLDKIDGLYSSTHMSSKDLDMKLDYQTLDEEELKKLIKETVTEALFDLTAEDQSLNSRQASMALKDDDQDLFEFGLNSLKSIRIKMSLQRIFNLDAQSLPMNFVYEYPTVSKLKNYFINLKGNANLEQSRVINDKGHDHDLMRSLVQKYSSFEILPPLPRLPVQDGDNGRGSGVTVLLTGATGSLGAHILKKLLERPENEIREVICLVRTTDGRNARDRVFESFESRRISTQHLSENEKRLRFLRFDLSKNGLGISDEDIKFTTDANQFVIIHAAWMVDFLKPLPSFERENLKGLQSLLNLLGRLAKSTDAVHQQAEAVLPSKFILCSSLSSVSNTKSCNEDPDGLAREIITHDPNRAVEIGYAQSKWVAEEICDEFGKVEVTVLRIGQLCGDLETGVWNKTEYWPLLISSCRFTGCLPLLDRHPSWLPVDVCAQAIVEDVVICARISGPHDNFLDEVEDQISSKRNEDKGATVYHLFNPNTTVPWNDIVKMVQKQVKQRDESINVEVVDSLKWLEKLDESESDLNLNPSKKLLGMWKDQFSSQRIHEKSKMDMKPEGTSFHENQNIDSTLANIDLQLEKRCGPISEEWIDMFISAMELFPS